MRWRFANRSAALDMNASHSSGNHSRNTCRVRGLAWRGQERRQRLSAEAPHGESQENTFCGVLDSNGQVKRERISEKVLHRKSQEEGTRHKLRRRTGRKRASGRAACQEKQLIIFPQVRSLRRTLQASHPQRWHCS